MAEDRLSKESSIYHYTLIKRIHHHPFAQVLHSALIVMTSALPALLDHWSRLWLPLLAFVFVLGGHALVVLLYFRVRHQRPILWKFTWKIPWYGYLPPNYISVALIWRVHIHVFAVGLASCILFIPWTPPSFYVALLLVHIWTLSPRLWWIRMLMKTNPEGMLKLDARHTSLYKA